MLSFESDLKDAKEEQSNSQKVNILGVFLKLEDFLENLK